MTDDDVRKLKTLTQDAAMMIGMLRSFVRSGEQLNAEDEAHIESILLRLRFAFPEPKN